jgi:hypothetical protein
LLGNVVNRLDDSADLFAERAELLDFAGCLANDTLEHGQAGHGLGDCLDAIFSGQFGLLAGGRDCVGIGRPRIYALLRTGDLVAAAAGDDDSPGPLRIERSSVDRWLVAGGPLTLKNA